MDISDLAKKAMPPPSLTGRPAELGGLQQPQDYPEEPSSKKQRLACDEEEEEQPSTVVLKAPTSGGEPMAHSDPVTLWQGCVDQVRKEVEATCQDWLKEFANVHEEEKASVARIQEMYKTAQDMNISFHDQLDSLFNAMREVMSSAFKK